MGQILLLIILYLFPVVLVGTMMFSILYGSLLVSIVVGAVVGAVCSFMVAKGL